MPKKPTLTDVTNIYTAAPIINANNDKVEGAFENTLSRDGSTPNNMEADLDMNSNDLLNVNELDAQKIFLSGSDITTQISSAQGFAEDAQVAAAAAEQSAEQFAVGLATSYGLSPDNTALENDAALLSVPKGATIDFRGETYPITNIPTDFRSFNGRWQVGSLAVDMRKDGGSPFDAQVVTVGSYPFSFWPAGGWNDEEEGKMHVMQTVSSSHVTTYGSRIDELISVDQGATFKRRTIFSDTTARQVVHSVFGKMGGGRVGGVASVTNPAFVSAVDTPSEISRHQYFIWKDDGEDWQSEQISGLTIGHFVYGDMHKGFSGADGDFIVATYAGTRDVKLLRTVDNGETWTEIVVASDAGLPGSQPVPSEPLILNDGGDNWAVFVRVETSGPKTAENMYVTISTDNGVTWSALQDTGYLLGSNPVFGVYDGGKFELMYTMRDGFVGTEAGNVIRGSSIDPAAFFADVSVVSRTPIVDLFAIEDRGIGYFNGFKIPRIADDPNGEWVFFGKSNESSASVTLGASANMVRVSRLPIAIPAAHPCLQLVKNSGFTLKRRGTTFAASNSNTPFADRMVTQPSGSNMAVTLTPMTEAQRGIFPMWDTVATFTGTANDYAGFSQTHVGQDAQDMCRVLDLGGKLTARLYGFGPLPTLDLRILVNGVSRDTTPPTFTSPPPSAYGGWVTEVEFQLADIAVLPSDVTTLQLVWSTFTRTEAWEGAGICGAPLWSGENPPMDGPRFTDPIDNSYLQRWDGDDNRFLYGRAVSATSAWFDVPAHLMKPSVVKTVSYSDISHIFVETSSVSTEYAVSALTVTSVQAWNGVFRLIATTSTGMTPGHVAVLKLNSASDPWLMIDTKL